MPNPNGLTRQSLFLVLPIPAVGPVNAWSSFLQVVPLRRDASNVHRFLPKHPFVIAGWENQARALKCFSCKCTHHLLMQPSAGDYSHGTTVMKGNEKGSLPCE